MTLPKTWYRPVEEHAHYELLAKGYKFVESCWEWELAVSRYRGPNGEIVRVDSTGRVLHGEKKPVRKDKRK